MEKMDGIIRICSDINTPNPKFKNWGAVTSCNWAQLPHMACAGCICAWGHHLDEVWSLCVSSHIDGCS